MPENPYYIKDQGIGQSLFGGFQQGYGLRQQMKKMAMDQAMESEKLKAAEFGNRTDYTDEQIGLSTAGLPAQGQMGPSAPKPLPNSFTFPFMQSQQVRHDQATIRNDAKNEANKNRAASQGFGRENTLRDEFNTLSKPFQIIAPMYKNIEVAANDPQSSPQKDMSMIFAYMKLLDPNSTVREGEYANAGKAGQFGDRVQVALNKIDSGELLTPQQRQEFLASAKQVYSNAESQQRQHIDRYKGLSQRGGVDPEMVIFDYAKGLPSFEKTPQDQTDQTLNGGWNPDAELARIRAAREKNASKQ